MRILITGANGQLGTELQDVLAAHTLVLFPWPEFELLSERVQAQVQEARPDVVIHTAAYTDVDKAEQERDLAFAVNAEGTERVARAAAACRARLIYISTDYVFDGHKQAPYRETDTPHPINVYGCSKLEGERQSLACCSDALVVRTAWLYGAKGRNFVTSIMRLAHEQSELRVVADQRGSPTHAKDLALVLAALVEADVKGIVHAAGAGDCTWHELASAIVSHLGLSLPVVPITTADAERPAPRPAYSVLANESLASLGITLPHWKDSLARFMSEYRARKIQRGASAGPGL